MGLSDFPVLWYMPHSSTRGYSFIELSLVFSPTIQNKICTQAEIRALTELQGTATLMISMFYQKELHEPLIFIQVSSKSVEKWGFYRHLNNSIWPTFSRHFEYLISFQNFLNCLIFSNQFLHNISVSADMRKMFY